VIRRVVCAVLAATCAAVAGACGGSEPSRRTVAVYGDSLLAESQADLEAALRADGRTNVRVSSFGGTALCDWVDTITQDARERPADIVVLTFSGNNMTTCTRDATGRPLAGDALRARYLSDAVAVMEATDGATARVLWVSAPTPRPVAPGESPADDRAVELVFETVAQRYARAEFVDAGAAVEDGGQYADTLPCLPGEPCPPSGRVPVRSPDGVHFCPLAYEPGRPCRSWSSGAWRFGNAIADAVIAVVDALDAADQRP
jgi:lysophospholipase L1-like esterase